MLPDLSVVWVIFFVLLLTVVLDRLLFKPVLRVMVEGRDAEAVQHWAARIAGSVEDGVHVVIDIH